MITPNQHEKDEWTRFAQWAYEHGRDDLGDRYSMAASLACGQRVPDTWFDRHQSVYRAWLVFGEVPDHALTEVEV